MKRLAHLLLACGWLLAGLGALFALALTLAIGWLATPNRRGVRA